VDQREAAVMFLVAFAKGKLLLHRTEKTVKRGGAGIF